MSYDNTAHAWANQTGKNTSAGRVYYSGDTIYSYGSHFPIARILTNQRVVLFTSRSYSKSTGNHKSRVRRAIDDSRYMVFVVNDVLANSKAAHTLNFRDMVTEIGTLIERASRARLYSVKGDLIAQAQTLLNNANGYRAFFNLRVAPLTDLESVNIVMAKLRKGEERAKRAAEKKARELQRLAVVESRERLRDWLRGKDVYPPRTPRPYVRIAGDTVETTWGARVPLDSALKVYGIAKKCRAHRKAFEPKGERVEVGDFSLKDIDSTGAIHVGCHHVPFRFAKLAACLGGIEGMA